MFRRVKGDADAMFRRVKALQGTVKVGVMSGTYPDGTPVAEVAQYLEFGTSDIPSRPFMRTGLRKFAAEGSAHRKATASAAVTGRIGRNKALVQTGEQAKAAVIAQIDRGTPPALDPDTAKAKGSSRTLIDTGRLRASIDVEVE